MNVPKKFPQKDHVVFKSQIFFAEVLVVHVMCTFNRQTFAYCHFNVKIKNQSVLFLYEILVYTPRFLVVVE